MIEDVDKIYTVCYLTGILYAVVRQISMLFIDNKISVFCILRKRSRCYWETRSNVKGQNAPTQTDNQRQNMKKSHLLLRILAVIADMALI